jgi:hypothetical protein
MMEETPGDKVRDCVDMPLKNSALVKESYVISLTALPGGLLISIKCGGVRNSLTIVHFLLTASQYK